jgi:hypothetical protein
VVPLRECPSFLPNIRYLIPQVSVLAIGNTIQAYLTLSYTSRVYSENPDKKAPKPTNPVTPLAPRSTVTPLSARTFGTWTAVQTMVRFYAAYNIDNPAIYQMALGTYVIAFAHFGSEWFYFKTVKWGAPLAGPVIVSTVSMVWMIMQWGYYVK